MKIDYLIIGQGIAGSILSYTLLSQGLEVLVLDEAEMPNASQVASGVCNPITGRRLVKTWLADTLFAFLHPFYRSLEEQLESHFFYDKQVYRPFNSVKDQNDWFVHSSRTDWDRFANAAVDHQPYRALVENPYGGWETCQAAYIQVEVMLNAYQRYLQKQNRYRNARFTFEELTLTASGIEWKDVQARQLIFCEGAQASENPFFNYLPFRPDKGEWLKIRIPGARLYNMIKKDIFIIPLEDDTFLISGTYHQQNLNYQPTEAARQELSTKLNRVLKCPYEILDQRAGVRPSTKHRRPFLGRHPQYPALGIFNGMGTKGLSLSPFFAHHLYEHLEQARFLIPEVDIARYANQ